MVRLLWGLTHNAVGSQGGGPSADQDFLCNPGWVPIVQPWLGKRWACFLGDTCPPTVLSSPSYLSDSPSVLLREGQVYIEVTQQPRGDEDWACLLREGGGQKAA